MNSEIFYIRPDIQEALNEGYPVVALESTLITHGMPYPQNIETARSVEQIVLSSGALPATIAVLDGKIRVGLESSDLERLGKNQSGSILKLSKRDLPYAIATRVSGGTTVAATLYCADLAGIRVFSTGGIGGVHRGAEKTFDISADLNELSQTSVALVCAGAKSILDIGLTLEVLETLSVPVIGYQSSSFPSFYSRESQFPVTYRMDSLKEIADLVKCKWLLGSPGGVLVANPIPKEDELEGAQLESFIEEGIREAELNNIRGKNMTPFLLAYLNSKTGGQSLTANISLIKNNARVGAELAKALAL